MKITYKLKMVLISILSLFALLCCITGFTVVANQTKGYELLLNGEFKNFYQVGDELVVPSAVVTNGTKEYVASFNVVLPDKTVTKNQSLYLTKAGNYSIEYQAYVQDEQYYVTKNFDIVVNNSLFSVIGEGNVGYVNYNDKISGAVATLYNGDTLTYNDYIDLTKIGNTPLFKMLSYPQVVGEADANRLVVKITDIHDENKFVTVRIKKSEEASDGVEWGWICSYIDAKFTDGTYNSAYIGMNWNENGKYTSNGYKYSIDKNSESYGANVSISLTGGKKGNAEISSNAYALRYDYNKNQLHGSIFTASKEQQHLIADFANLDIFPQLFAGFTDGKVKVSITPEGFNKSSCKIIFTEFAGKTVLEKNYNTFIYEQAPLIDIDYGEFTEDTVPNGLPNVEYSVYQAKGFDYIDGEINVDTKVYFGYSNSRKINIDVVDGKFKPKNTGIYTIEYTAKNSFGVLTVKTVDILISAKNHPLTFSVDGYVSSALAGQKVKLLQDYSAENYYGNTELNLIVEFLDNPQVKFELSKENDYTFMPIYAGQYKVTLLCKDYVEMVSKEETFEVSANKEIIYNVNGYFPHYLIKNGIYNMPTISAVELSSGVPVSVETELYMVKSDNSEIKCDGSLLTVPEDSVVKLCYRPIGIDWASPYERSLPVVDTGLGTSKISKKDYFHTTKGEFLKGATMEDVYYVVKNLQDNQASLEFLNVLQGDNFFISFAPYISENGYKQVNSIEFTLYDVADATRFVKLTIAVRESGVFLIINDGAETKLANSYGAVEDLMTISYDVTSGVSKINSTLDVEVGKFYGLNQKAIFQNGIFAEITINAETTDCGIRINTLNDQFLSSSTRDRNAPVVDLSSNDNEGEHELNEIVTFNPYKVYDVLSPTVAFSYYVKKPNGEYAKTVDGIMLNGEQDVNRIYEIKLDSVGDYEVYLIAEDVINSVKDTNKSYKITVLDRTLPVITFGNSQSSAKIGETVSIVKYSVDKANCVTFVSVLSPNGTYELVKGKSFTPKQKGVYVVTVTAFDANGNISHKSYSVTVK